MDSPEKLKEGYSKIGAIILRSVTQNIQKATKELKAMNAEMVSIQKVTQATDADMERLKNSAFEVAGDLGSKPSDYLSSVTKWVQAGYKGLSEQLGELSAKTQVVGDVNEETANKFLLAVDAAYKYKGNIDALTRVLDGANEISNNYATSVEKLAGGMGIVSSLAEQGGMKVEETMAAIGTITAKTQESGNSAARALRALILNIQGSTEIEIDAETGERWTEDEIQRIAAALGDLNVATREYKDGIMQLRNPMKVIGELAEKYRDGLVTEAQLQDVVASLGGKVRSNQMMVLIQGYETYTSMIETYKDAVGSADKELDDHIGEIQDQIDKANEELDRVNDAWNEQKDREEEALALQKKQLAVEEAQRAVGEALLALQTARNERNVYTLKDDLEAEKKAAEERKKQAEKQYDDWMDTWRDIQKSIEEPARDLSEILNDIARYGTPAMADQVDRVTELLRDLGYAIEGVTGGGGFDSDDNWNGGTGDQDGRAARRLSTG